MSTDETARSSTIEDEVVVVYRSVVGLARWQERHAQSPVPSAWPYGLDELANHLSAVDAVDVESPSGVRGRLGRLVGPRPTRRGPRAAVALAWDELTALDMLRRQHARRYFSGVIWATDTLAASGDSRQLRAAARALRQMDGLWVLSRPQADAVRHWLGRDCPPVHFLRFGVDPRFYSPAVDALPRPHVVSVGGDRDRDPTTLFAALEAVHEAHPGARITVQTRSDHAAPAGIDKVDRLTHLEVAALLRTASVVALATRPNLHASGMTVGLEAQASAVPVVACDTPGMRDYFTDGVTARLVPPSDPTAMAAAVVELLDDPATARDMGERGREEVLASHTVSSMAAELASIVLGSTGTP